MEQLILELASPDLRICQKSVMPLEIIANKKPELFDPYYDKLIDLALNPTSSGSRRNVMRTLQFLPIPEEYSGTLYDICSDWILDLKQAIAVRAFAMEVAYNIGKDYDEICRELQFMAEQCMKDESAGVRSKAKNLLKKLKA